MKFCKTVFLVGGTIAGVVAEGSGFGLYEASAGTYALGGAVVGRAYDASANFHNPATLTDLTNIMVTAGFMTEHPRARMKVDGHKSTKMDAGMFTLPHVHVAVPLPWDFVAGIGLMPEYGLGTRYTKDWALVYNSHDTTVESFTVNPNLAYKITDKWSVGAGARICYFDFTQHSYPMGSKAGVVQRLKGDNGMHDWGWQIGTKYDILDCLSVGVVYKSKTEINVKGSSHMNYDYPTNGKADTDLDLPQSITAGFNWDITDDWHLGGLVAWTDWSSVGTLDFNLNGIHKPIKLQWEDTYRVGIAPSWDFAEDWTAMCSYVFETDCCGDQDSTMLPPSHRHMISAGLAWSVTDNLTFDLTYGMILMDGQDSDCTVNGVKHTYSAHRGISHAAGLSVTYRF